jgi:hypothetical protein
MRTRLLFLLKFLVLVAVLLPAWVRWAAEPYLGLLATETAATLRVGGYTIYASAADARKIYLQVDPTFSLDFETVMATLNLVVFVALLFSSSGLGWRRRLAYLALGVVVLNLFQVGYVVVHFVVNYRYGPNTPQFRTTQSVSEMLLLISPFLLWALFEAPRLFRSLRRPTPSAS